LRSSAGHQRRIELALWQVPFRWAAFAASVNT
jgi:hypothetical protein